MTCYSSTAMTLHSVVAQALVEQGGASIRSEAAKYRDARVGDVVALPGGRLKSSYVLAVVANAPRDMPTLASITSCIATLLSRAASLGLTSLAIPLLRAGRQLELEDILRATLTPVIDHLHGVTTLRHVSIGLQSHHSPVASQSLTHYLERNIEGLVALGKLRARIVGLEEFRQRLTLFGQSSSRFTKLIRRVELGLQRQVWALLDLERVRQNQGADSLALELRRCEELLGTLVREQAAPKPPMLREHAVGE